MLNSIKNLNKFQASSEILSLIISLYCTIFLNNSFWSNIYNMSIKLENDSLFFIINTFMITLLLQILIMNLIIWPKFAKFASIFLITVTVIANYFSKNYGIHFDRSMLQNIFNTNISEASELITSGIFFDYLYFGLIPCVIILFCCKITQKKFIFTLLHKLTLTIILITIICILIFIQFKNLISITKYHKEIKYQLLPSSLMISTARIIFQAKLNFNPIKTPIDPAAFRESNKFSKLPITTVLVIGETVRSANWGLSGYIRQTTPKLANLPVINFPYAISCGTNTDVSLPCMFSSIGRSNYNESKIKSTGSILHLLDTLNIDVTWIENQSGCKGVCTGLKELSARSFDVNKKYCHNSLNCLDAVLIEGLKANILNTNKDQIIILHQLGNHGPAYFNRYPEEFNQFTPACNSCELTNCSSQEIINAYDNAILYTDQILAKIIQEIANIKSRNFFLIYVSDHGESLGENNIYLHGMPYAIAPMHQKMVPMLFWHSSSFPVDHQCLANKALFPTDHDHLYHTLLGLFQVKSNTYIKNQDLIAGCYKN